MKVRVLPSDPCAAEEAVRATAAKEFRVHCPIFHQSHTPRSVIPPFPQEYNSRPHAPAASVHASSFFQFFQSLRQASCSLLDVYAVLTKVRLPHRSGSALPYVFWAQQWRVRLTITRSPDPVESSEPLALSPSPSQIRPKHLRMSTIRFGFHCHLAVCIARHVPHSTVKDHSFVFLVSPNIHNEFRCVCLVFNNVWMPPTAAASPKQHEVIGAHRQPRIQFYSEEHRWIWSTGDVSTVCHTAHCSPPCLRLPATYDSIDGSSPRRPTYPLAFIGPSIGSSTFISSPGYRHGTGSRTDAQKSIDAPEGGTSENRLSVLNNPPKPTISLTLLSTSRPLWKQCVFGLFSLFLNETPSSRIKTCATTHVVTELLRSVCAIMISS